MKLPSMPRKGQPVEDTVREIINFCRAIRITGCIGGNAKITPNGTTLEFKPGKTAPTAGAATDCPFGRIITWQDGEDTITGIQGGIIHCGTENWNIDPQALNLAVDGVWLVWLEIDCTVNLDDDSEILLPGVDTGTQPTGDWSKAAWTLGDNYPANTAPTIPTGNGTVILPVGKLTIADAAATLENAGCGHFIVTHCAGTIGYSRA